jgi:CheY-like chemotaxis protein
MTTRIAHDLNELLAPLLANALALEEEIAQGHPLRGCVESLRKTIDDAHGFAQRLMAIDVRRKLPLEAADLAQVVQDLLPALRAVLGREIEVECSVSAPLVSVRLERGQMEQALLQLARNARDATPGEGTFDIDIGQLDGGASSGKLPPGRWLRLRLRDSGRGMEPALLAQVFEPFVTTKVAGRGTGLGLAAVYATVRQHDGWIDAESQPGKGSTFSIYLPSANNAAAAATPAPPEAAPPAPTATLLLVEDNAMVRRSVDAILRGMGYHVIAVDSGEKCIEAVKKSDDPIDLLITDIVMPEMNGRELIERVRALRPDVPVLFMSGYDRSTLASRNLSATVEHFLQKPFDSQELADAVAKAIGQPAPNGT